MEIWPAILEVWRNWDIYVVVNNLSEGRKAFAEHIRALEDFLKNQKL